MRTSAIECSVLICLTFGAAGLAQNGDPVKSKRPIAMVGGQAIYDDDLPPSVGGQLFRLRSQEYEIAKRALGILIEQRLLEVAARKKGITADQLLQQEVDAKVEDPTEAELLGYYLAQRDRLNRPLGEIKDQLRIGFRSAKAQQLRQEYLSALRAASGVASMLEPPRIEVGYNPEQLRGDPKAPVTIIEFSDYGCPYCRQAESTLRDLLARYGNKVNLAYRDFPLPSLHPGADLAAEACRCAADQGKFWEYHDHLFNTSSLSRDALLHYARVLKLDQGSFDSCLSGGKYKAAVQADVEDGTRAGVSGTPAFFINGVPLSGSQPLDVLARAVDEELARKR